MHMHDGQKKHFSLKYTNTGIRLRFIYRKREWRRRPIAK